MHARTSAFLTGLLPVFLSLAPSPATAQVTFQLNTAQGACVAVTDNSGLQLVPGTEHLTADGVVLTGDGCGAGAPSVDVTLNAPAAASTNTDFSIEWTPGPDATVCVYTGTAAAGWPAGSVACSSASACAGPKTNQVKVAAAGSSSFGVVCSSGAHVSRSVSVSPPAVPPTPDNFVLAGNSEVAAETPLTISWPSVANAQTCTASATPAVAAWSGDIPANPAQREVAFPSPGTYSLSLQCRNAHGTINSQARQVTVTAPAGGGSCPAGRQTQAELCYNVNMSSGTCTTQAVTTFQAVYGKGTPSGTTVPFPGVNADVVYRNLRKDQYIALEFTVPTSGLEGASGKVSKGETLPGPLLDGTISEQCGQFEPVQPADASCAFKRRGFSRALAAWGVNAEGANCNLVPGKTYFLNLRISDPFSLPNPLDCSGNTCRTATINYPVQ